MSWPAFTIFVPVTAYHQRSCVETYSRYKSVRGMDIPSLLLAFLVVSVSAPMTMTFSTTPTMFFMPFTMTFPLSLMIIMMLKSLTSFSCIPSKFMALKCALFTTLPPKMTSIIRVKTWTESSFDLRRKNHVVTSFNLPMSLVTNIATPCLIATPIGCVIPILRPIEWAPFVIMSMKMMVVPLVCVPMPYIPEPHVTTDTICLIPHNINDRLLDHSRLHNRFSRCDWRRGWRGKWLWHLYNRWRRSILLHNHNLALCVSSHIATTRGSAIRPTLKNNRRTYLNRR